MRIPFALVILCALTRLTLAQGTEECRSIPDRTARLACYDREAPPATSRMPASACRAGRTRLQARCLKVHGFAWLG